jgi:hypothetical protein
MLLKGVPSRSGGLIPTQIMKSTIQKRFENLTTRLIRKNKGTPKYTFDLQSRPFTPETRGVQLGSHLKYSVNVERKF